MFTVELNSLQDSDSGDYWCAVEIGDKWTPDDGDYLYLTVSADPAVSVINSRVSGQEGGSVSVQCLYRTDYKNKQKQWCRFRDWSCLTSQNSAVQISDDGRGVVSAEMSGLKKSDAGWYWFSAGEVGVTVHLTVTERPTSKITSIRNTADRPAVTTPKSESVKTLRNVAVKSGEFLTIPCFYDEQYKSNPKYWCTGYFQSLCQIVARTNTSGRTSVTDYPTQNMFTVELNSLQDSDSGYYWCAVEIKGGSDDSDYLYLTVSADPAVSVINSRVSGQEGGSVSVQCLYRTDYKNKQKQWCRFRDWRCLTSQNSAVQISDDGRGAVSVEMSGLKKSDAGWYWFSAGKVGVTVHLTVTERPTTVTTSSTEKTSISEITSESESVKTLRNVAVKSGGSLTIPCFYDEQYKSNPKYWCKGKYWSSCGIVARTNTRGRTSVTDNPTQNMFTVELNSLQDSDSGYYWCAVEIKSGSDDGDYLYLTVSADPAVSVNNSRVSGQEGGSVSVQCLYRTDYKNKQKQWCRFRDWSCLTSQNSSVQISDDGRGAVSVEMSGLKKSDAGWYWFSAGEVGVTVHLTVTERPTTTTAVTTISSTEKSIISEISPDVETELKAVVAVEKKSKLVLVT
ncbi:polymeric immunoglobulin receptor-like [Hoplias malabaricus]|uniref:polymeric immunoglobulin receptor-like n=1 Tax=Hoplias malabaricus TaxID=27720 RepID=UPI0034636139